MTDSESTDLGGPAVTPGARSFAPAEWAGVSPPEPPPAVVVATPGELGAWPVESRSEAVWVVVGDGPLPAGCEPFLHLPATSSAGTVAAGVAAALRHAELRRRAASLAGEVTAAAGRQAELARIGSALSAERDLGRLLERIMTSARGLVNADAGSLYLLDRSETRPILRFELAQNDSVPAAFVREVLQVDSTSLAGFVAANGQTVRVADVRELGEESPLQFNARFDASSGYLTTSLLATPMATRSGEVVGVLQLINRKNDPGARCRDGSWPPGAVRPFDQSDEEVIKALAALAAVAIENSRLVQEVEGLFEGFVRAAVIAIEQRDPTTSGHSLRVAHFTVCLARLLERTGHPELGTVRFSRDELTQLRYAALLHDFGKVGVREAVLTKARKLYPEGLALIQERFRHALRAREAGLLRQVLVGLARAGRAPGAGDLEQVEQSISAARARTDELMAMILQANEPTVLDRQCSQSLSQLTSEVFPGPDGEPLALLWPEEARALLVPRGSLDDEERREVESHVVHSFRFLLTLPWPRRFARVPDIAHGHHEKLNGRGYPNQVTGEHIPVEVRMMTVCDIFDALTAGDRPYKRAVSSQQALAILEQEAEAGGLDPHLVKLFIDGKVFAQTPGDPAAA